MKNDSGYFGGIYKNKRVLVTGHTGFKGSWLTLYLLKLEAVVAGLSLYLPSDPCHFDVIQLENHINHYETDIRNFTALVQAFDAFQPEIVFHLAAQPIVRRSFKDPKLTFDSNLGGTVNILECIRQCPTIECAVIITSDKCYQNNEWEWGYREIDRLGGDDPYSASKACAEIACSAYHQSFFKGENAPCIATARAGNVIGGGDWAADRIVPDCVRAISSEKEIVVRNPSATRPWQHVLEPLSGYLQLGSMLYQKQKSVIGHAFNFGPHFSHIQPVGVLVDRIIEIWGKGAKKTITDDSSMKESNLLMLSCEKALAALGWHSLLDFEDAVRLSIDWYRRYYMEPSTMFDFSMGQIDSYLNLGSRNRMPWGSSEGINEP